MLKNKKGFTLVEIVIVIVIIAILAAILVPNIVKWVDKSKLATLKSEASTVRDSVSAYVIHEIGDDLSKNVITQDNITTYCSDFWNDASKAANTTLQCTNEDKDGYMTFEVNKGTLKSFTYSKGGHTAIYDGIDWKYE